MSLRRLSALPNSHTLQRATAARTSLILTPFVIACCLLSTPAHASGSLPIGTMTVNTTMAYCDPTSGWFYYQNGGTNTYLNCRTATIQCNNTQNPSQDINLMFGWLNPVGIVPNITVPLGTIVLFNGGPGTSPGFSGFALNYFTAGYEIVELAWASDWEQTYLQFGGGNPPYGNIQNAACRPATFLNYVNSSIFSAVQTANSHAAMCAQGLSAGSAQLAYSMAYYGAGDLLDNVEFVSGPVLSDVEQGCQVPSANPVTVCGLTNYMGGQFGCQLGGGSTWSLNPTYLTGPNTSVGQWTNDPTCANTNGTYTTPPSQARWLAQSIVDQGTGATPTFTYSSTAMSAWLCRSVFNDTQLYCPAIGNNNINFCPNNSSPQGQIFYANIGASNAPPHYDLYAVDLCVHAEGVEQGNVPGYNPTIFPNGVTGANAIMYDMIGYPPSIPPQCVRRH